MSNCLQPGDDSVGELRVEVVYVIYRDAVYGLRYEPHHSINSGPASRLTYSARRATIGSTLVARRAGIKLDSTATPMSTSEIMINVVGSVALTPKSKLDIKRVKMKAAARPKTTPIKTSFNPCPTTIFSTSLRCAPRAMRSPISRVRCSTE